MFASNVFCEEVLTVEGSDSLEEEETRRMCPVLFAEMKPTSIPRYLVLVIKTRNPSYIWKKEKMFVQVHLQNKKQKLFPRFLGRITTTQSPIPFWKNNHPSTRLPLKKKDCWAESQLIPRILINKKYSSDKCISKRKSNCVQDLTSKVKTTVLLKVKVPTRTKNRKSSVNIFTTLITKVPLNISLKDNYKLDSKVSPKMIINVDVNIPLK